MIPIEGEFPKDFLIQSKKVSRVREVDSLGRSQTNLIQLLYRKRKSWQSKLKNCPNNIYSKWLNWSIKTKYQPANNSTSKHYHRKRSESSRNQFGKSYRSLEFMGRTPDNNNGPIIKLDLKSLLLKVIQIADRFSLFVTPISLSILLCLFISYLKSNDTRLIQICCSIQP